MDNEFKNITETKSERRSSSGFKNRVLVPFLSGVLGCSLVIGTCFGVPQIKSKILGTTSTYSSTSSKILPEPNTFEYNDVATISVCSFKVLFSGSK